LTVLLTIKPAAASL